MPGKPQRGQRGGNAGIRLYLTGSNLLCVTLIRMSTSDILTLIDAEIARLEQARTLLAGLQGQTTTEPAKKPVKRKMSAAARERMATAQRKRWAAVKAAVKTTPAKAAKKTAPPAKKRATPKLSAAARKSTESLETQLDGTAGTGKDRPLWPDACWVQIH